MANLWKWKLKVNLQFKSAKKLKYVFKKAKQNKTKQNDGEKRKSFHRRESDKKESEKTTKKEKQRS